LGASNATAKPGITIPLDAMSSSDEEAEEAEVANIVVPLELEQVQEKMDVDDDNVDGEQLKKKEETPPMKNI
jgi:hypothetical protein